MQVASTGYILGLIFSVGAAALFAVTNVIYKKMDEDVSVFEIIVTRVWISLPFAALFLLPIINTDGFAITPEIVLIQTFSMFIGMVIGDSFYFMSQSRIGVSRAYPIAASYPLFLYVLAAMFLGEPVMGLRIAGAVLVISGVALIAYEQREEAEVVQSDVRREMLVGVLFALLTIIAWSLSDFALQVGLVDVDPLDVNFIRIAIGSMLVIPGIPLNAGKKRSKFDRKLMGIVLLTGLLGYGVPMLLMTFAVYNIGATLNSVIIAASPLISAPISVLFLREKATKIIVLGTLIIFLGVVMVIMA